MLWIVVAICVVTASVVSSVPFVLAQTPTPTVEPPAYAPTNTPTPLLPPTPPPTPTPDLIMWTVDGVGSAWVDLSRTEIKQYADGRWYLSLTDRYTGCTTQVWLRQEALHSECIDPTPIPTCTATEAG